MSFENLWAGLHAQLESERALESEADVRTLADAESATVAWVERLRGTPGEVEVRLITGDLIRGRVQDCATQWFTLESTSSGEAMWIVANAGVVSLAGLGRHVLSPDDDRFAHISWLRLLRQLMREQATVRLWTLVGAVDCRIQRVLSDHLDVTLRDHFSQEKMNATGRTLSVALTAVAAVELSQF